MVGCVLLPKINRIKRSILIKRKYQNEYMRHLYPERKKEGIISVATFDKTYNAMWNWGGYKVRSSVIEKRRKKHKYISCMRIFPIINHWQTQPAHKHVSKDKEAKLWIPHWCRHISHHLNHKERGKIKWRNNLLYLRIS